MRRRKRRDFGIVSGSHQHRNRTRLTLAVAALVGAVAVCLGSPGFGSLWADTYLLLYSGRWIIQHGLPHHATLTLAAGGRGVVDQQWLAAVIDYESWRVAGYNGLALLSAASFGGGLAGLAVLLRRRGASMSLTFCCAALALFTTLGLTFIRAQLFAIPLFVAVLWLCVEDSQRPEPSWRALALLAVLVLWANLHGSVLVGAALAVAYLLGRAVSRRGPGCRRARAAYLVLAAGAALTALATPYGVHMLGYYREMLGNHALGLADVEWNPPSFPALSFFQFAIPLAIGLIAAGFAMRGGRRPAWVLALAFVLTAIAAAIAVRNEVWLGLAASALVADALRGALPRVRFALPAPLARPWREATLDLVPFTAAALACLGLGQLVIRGPGAFESHAPLRALAATASYVSAHPCARVLGDDASASALLWLDPNAAGHVGFDAQLEAYPSAALADWVAFESASGRGWLRAADGYQVLVGSATTQPALVARLQTLAGGRALASDSRGIAVLHPASSAGCAANRTPGVVADA
ncbi:MAG: hypothetical protein JO156_16130 [Solirubrobacterales bacterium]|nr:hypothetical protein [Solirubrobacterales bacterium]